MCSTLDVYQSSSFILFVMGILGLTSCSMDEKSPLELEVYSDMYIGGYPADVSMNQHTDVYIDQGIDEGVYQSIDQDGDGFTSDQDCDDADPMVNPHNPLSCVWSYIPLCPVSIQRAFTKEEMDPPTQGSNRYRVPSIEERNYFTASIEAALMGDHINALNLAEEIGYQLCASETNLLWSSKSSGGAVLALRTHPNATSLIAEIPHAFFDLGTLEEGILVFERINARALLSTGTHRCASDIDSGCAGSTQVCSLLTTGDFRMSDMAHTEESLFHAAHENLSRYFDSAYIISLHAFLEPGVSVSNGTQKPTSSDSMVAYITESMTRLLPNERITSCNDYGASNYETRVCGTTNTQGRHINGSPDACGTRPNAANNRFIHIEQNILLLNQPNVLVEAIDQVF